ncbi:hypothetical protein PQ456_20090 [Paenibacillus kyungheensis]|uniref:Uncharacterized protein n=1 Tax=Paenibacillus kyungheensis TaxID=1452732 RepID=A0AAX3LZV3_9BACL|nr:hypothetical protein [Paenibacillus kyungheensis]WCT55421.1 hypothetical protein PQ456_20090 [Paenibacillus kyungheensis]
MSEQDYRLLILMSITWVLMVVAFRENYLHTVVANPYRIGKKFIYYRRTPKQINARILFFQVSLGLFLIALLLNQMYNIWILLILAVSIFILHFFKQKKDSRFNEQKMKMINKLSRHNIILPEEEIWDIESNFESSKINIHVNETLKLVTDPKKELYFYAVTPVELIVGIQKPEEDFFFTAIPLSEIKQLAILAGGLDFQKYTSLGTMLVIGYGINRQFNRYSKTRSYSIIQRFIGTLLYALDAQTWQEPTFTGFPHRDHPAFVAYEFHGDLSSYPEPYLPFLRQP